jgi:hypothetical protein
MSIISQAITSLVDNFGNSDPVGRTAAIDGFVVLVRHGKLDCFCWSKSLINM